MENTTVQQKSWDQPNTPLAVKVRYCLYARKSTEADEKQALSIESQVKEMLRVAERDGLEVADIRRESHSAKTSGERPVFNEIIEDIRRGRFNAILTWAPDRLSRNAGDLGTLVDLMDQKLLIEIRTYGQKFANSPNEKFLLMILGSQAKLENDNKSLNVKRGLRTRCEMGLWPGPAPTGYLNEKRVDRKCHILVDPERAPVIRQMFEKVAYEKWSGRKLYHWLRFELNFRTKSNHHLTLSNIYTILQNQFYYGVFEYPKGSGSWYTGKHKPLISRELFEKAREQLKREAIQRESKEFAFTKLFTCGVCGSGITADEKFKKLKDGTVARYVYYGCTRSRNLYCKGGYLREEELINQLVQLIDQVDVNDLGMRHKLEEEVKRYHRFQKSVLGIQEEKLNLRDVDIRTYAKYLLRDGSIVEKRELLSCIKSKLTIKNKVVSLEK
ncbi:MAG TPA: recombinase family protein [Candidatus Paceibacterota bacterium]|nr:recombinase family protein [Candidatus Paceibacterota bacterium]